jgi:AraC-like DNA-binding protein
MSLQVNIFLLVFGGIQGLLLTLFLIYKKLYNTAYVYLLLFLGTMLLQLTLKVMNKIWLMDNWPVLYTLSHFLPLLYGPLAYLFVKHLVEISPFNLKDSFHFVPFIFLYIVTVIGIHNSLPSGIEFIFNPLIRFVLLVASIAAYHLLAFKLWHQHMQKLRPYFLDAAAMQLNWVKKFIMVSAIVGMSVASALYLLYINYPGGHQYRYGFVALSICIYWISYSALTNPSIFSVMKGNANERVENNLSVPGLKAFLPNIKYSNSNLCEEQVQKICDSLERRMKENKLYLRPNLNIVQLANEVNCSKHHLSQVLNEQLQKSYYDYINCLRIEEAMHLLTEPRYQHYKIASIAYDAGFNSLSTFNDAFKKHTGKTPSDYRKESLKKEYRQQRV